ncbi:helix-turn-helix domain-containing protein [Nocardia mexicana]|uniref:helix-turn-helix domain-containing protein n=1 Tax=Nocardia mexicana TaxID=279262 RepID=UPI00082B42F1|nr:helix-turn-helix transcriptional regulator [Nocardia mexicana]
MVIVTKWTGVEVRALRLEALRWTQPQLAERTGFSEGVVRKWEARGASITLRGEFAEGMDTLLRGLDREQRARFESALSDIGRCAVADVGPAIRSGLAADRPRADLCDIDTERLAYVTAHPRRTDRRVLDELSVMLAAWRKLDDSVGSESVLPAVSETMSVVERLVREAHGAIRPAVLNVGAQWLQLTGWLNTTTKRHAIARVAHDRMLEWSVELGDPDLISTTLGAKGHRAWTEDEFGPMIGLSEAAGRYKQASPAVLAVAAQQEARGHALVGEAAKAERKLDEADDYAIRAAEEPNRIPPWLYFHSTDLLVLQRGLAYKFLTESGRPQYRRKAIDVLSAGLAGLDQETGESEWMRWYVDQLAELTRAS